MEINQGHRRAKLVQLLTTASLLVILVSMVGAYIYYGMYIAKDMQIVDVSTEQIPDAEINNTKRAEIIKALGQESGSMSADEKQETIDSLETPTPELTAESEAKRAGIIQALQQN